MNFSRLLDQIEGFPGVTDDTRDLVPGGIFVAGGGRQRRAEFAQQALAQGAAWIVCDEDLGLPASAPVVSVPCRRQAATHLALRFYADPARQLRVLGVTGTCGKTTTTYALEALFQAAGQQVGVIGTENIRYGDVCIPAQNTTPSVFVVQRTLAQMRAAGVATVVMEVSSHALEQQRVAGLSFDGAIFTNLSPEHLDFHGDMESYYQSKKRLFTEYRELAQAAGKRFHAVIHVGDDYGKRLYQELAQECAPETLHACALEPQPMVRVNGAGLNITPQGIHGTVHCKVQSGDEEHLALSSPLLGSFNAENLLAAVTLAQALGLPAAALSRGVGALSPVPGRMELVWSAAQRHVVVDFAHKPGALEVVMAALKALQPRRLIVVFGCGGQRDRAKRPLMGRLAAAAAERVILTADNSRGESTASITAEILAGVATELRDKCSVIEDRRAAIAQALSEAEAGDMVLLAGRGAEPGLNVLREDGTTETIPFDDRVVARELAARCWPDH